MANFHLILLFISALTITALLVPITIFLSRKIGAIEHGGYRKINIKPIPLLGGLSIAVPFILFLFLLTKFHDTKFLSLVISNKFLICWGISCIAILALGFCDDVFGLRARLKLLGQIAIAAFTVYVCLTNYLFTQIYLPFIGNMTISHNVSAIVSLIWIVGLINAFNLIDGIDGLASGIAFIVSLALIGLGIIANNFLLITFSVFFAGSLLAFIFFNFYPAKIFLGDTGSMFLGFVIATLTLMSSYKSHTAVIVLAPILALGFPIFEAIVSMLRRFIRGLPIFIGDSYHTHHRLLSRGYSQRSVVLILYSVSLLFALGAVMDQILPNQWRWIPILLFSLTLIWIAWLAGYLRLQVFNRIIYRRQQNTLLNAFAKYAILSFNSHYKNPTKIYKSLTAMCSQELHLASLRIKTKSGKTLLGYGKSHKSNKQYPREEIITDTLNSQRIIIEYQFDHQPDELERHDVSICLANIFSQSRFKHQ